MLRTIAITLLLCAFGGTQAQVLNDRNGIINGTLLHNMRDFPHHVSIYTENYTYCSGSILNSKWILTAATCVGWDGNTSITLMFNRLNVNISNALDSKSFTLTVNYAAAVTLHSSANLALIKLPVALQFSHEVAPVALSMNPNQNLTGLYATLPGIKQNTTLQSYGEFEIVSHEYCNTTNRICTLGYRNYSTVPCFFANGGGLVIDWPWAPRLVGVFSDPQSCLSYVPSAYFRISHYIAWISEIIGQRISNSGYFC